MRVDILRAVRLRTVLSPISALLARGVAITVDPGSGEPVDRVTPLVRGRLRGRPWLIERMLA